MRVLIVTICAAAVLVSGGAAATPRTGLWGVVTRGPIVPVCVAGQPCSAPARHVQLVFSQNGQALAQATTDDNGKYRLPLKAGVYTVKVGTQGARVGRGLEPTKVHTVATRWVRVDFSLDTGIR